MSENGEAYEVNLEKEFTISSKEDFQEILFDSGYEISLEKHKSVSSYYVNVENILETPISCHVEFCYIEKLGDFIEIETLTEELIPCCNSSISYVFTIVSQKNAICLD